VDAAVLYREQAARAGIDVNVIREPSDGYWSSVWSKVPFCMHAWSGRSTEDWMFSLVYAADAVWNDTHWHNERFDQLLKQARAERDHAQLDAAKQIIINAVTHLSVYQLDPRFSAICGPVKDVFARIGDPTNLRIYEINQVGRSILQHVKQLPTFSAISSPQEYLITSEDPAVGRVDTRYGIQIFCCITYLLLPRTAVVICMHYDPSTADDPTIAARIKPHSVEVNVRIRIGPIPALFGIPISK
jgi:hypothetical protein